MVYLLWLNIPEKCLARIFPNGFEDFYKSTLKKILSLIVYTKKTEESESINASAIAFIFYTQFDHWSYLGYKNSILSEANLVNFSLMSLS